MLSRALPILLLASVFLTTTYGAERIGVLYTGDPYPGVTPYIHMKVEPLLSVTPIQASRNHYAGISGSDIKRAIRVYMPRTYHSLTSTYDVIIISDSNVGSFTDQHLVWFERAVEEIAKGLVMIGGHETFGAKGDPDWGATPVGNTLPVETESGEYLAGKPEILDYEDPWIGSLPWRADLPFMQRYECNIVYPREGSRVLAINTIDEGRFVGHENPFFTSWEYPDAQGGRVFTMTGDWTPGGGWLLLQWEYLPDFATNLMLYVTQRDIPKDLDLVHTVRLRFATLGYRRMILTSLVDFVERFGANSRRVFEAVEEFDEAVMESNELYLELDFEAALGATNLALDLMDRAEQVAEEVKDQALLWVFITEWSVVSATSLICGFVLWTIMVRRRLYREVRTTTFRGDLE